MSMSGSDPVNRGMVRLPGGPFRMGSDHHYPEERPQHERHVAPFWIDPLPVTNAQFEQFVSATGYRTLAERGAGSVGLEGGAAGEPGSLVFQAPPAAARLADWRRWWRFVPGASWRHPEGRNSDIQHRTDHPVVHVCLHDALAYARWAGRQLPSEAQWEYAARGGLSGREFAWGDEVNPGGRWMANTWQGEFPFENLAQDGWTGTSPVGQFPANGFGLKDMIGNVWEWTRDHWTDHHRLAEGLDSQTKSAGAGGCCTGARHSSDTAQWHVLKGGSCLCADNYCMRYRPAARIALTADTATSHVGFRCAVDAKQVTR